MRSPYNPGLYVAGSRGSKQRSVRGASPCRHHRNHSRRLRPGAEARAPRRRAPTRAGSPPRRRVPAATTRTTARATTRPRISTRFPTPCRGSNRSAAFANRPYTVFGVEYVPATTCGRTRNAGIASWYGRKFHNQKTSNGETYDMYGMTAAHPTLPLPSYARVTNLADRQERRGARQRPRPVPRRAHHRPVVRRGASHRHRAERQRRGRGGEHPASRRAGEVAAQPLPPVASPRRRPRPHAGARRSPAATSSSSAHSPTTPMRRLLSRT